jgi:four helix bundle suffix protein
MNLTNVARSSLDECRKDYIKYLARRGLRHWQEGAAVFEEARQLRPKTLEEAAAWINHPGVAEPVEERAANLGAILATQAHWLIERLLDRQARDFETGGGFAERLYRARTGHPKPPVVSVPSVSQTPSKQSEPPA